MDMGSTVVTSSQQQRRVRVAQPWPMVFAIREWVWDSEGEDVLWFWGFQQVLLDVWIFDFKKSDMALIYWMV